ncbi:uncharacterized protein SAPINGB_P003447 [Magnusiomyces paraingens]|uniref:tRNA:m(4)X modification enzyme TRM13 n=1 Tax=Magnusiomyces paraingens TaxID=2606893 RepID=A0A5E8BUV5_9ASCO|nr:uncharacterized protein SAPINGB_P003447 [Saprochaete ingens]VVT53187.1 unnamed protein product [Saprochaete ingens]
MKKCQSIVPPPNDPWYSPDMNITDPSHSAAEKSEFSSSEYQKMAKALNELWETLWNKEELDLEVLNHDGLKERLSELEIPKHATQQASLIGHMEKSGLLGVSKLVNGQNPSSTIIAEFGCGRAELSRYVARSQFLTLAETNENQRTQSHRPFFLVDRAGPRMKFDTKILKDYQCDIDKILAEEKEKSFNKDIKIPPPFVKRALIDIKDLNLNVALNNLFPNDLNSDVVAISKHLCGCATDLTLQCLANNTSTLKSIDKPTMTHKLKGLVIALCCRQLCTYETYPLVGRKFLIDSGLITTPDSFRLLTKMTSWALCGRRDDMATDEESVQNHFSGLSIKEREVAGFLARRAIDHGRLLSLCDMGYQSKLIRYVSPETSLENVALIAQ